MSRQYLKWKARFSKLYIIIVHKSNYAFEKKWLETIVDLFETQNSTTERIQIICPNLDVFKGRLVYSHISPSS